MASRKAAKPQREETAWERGVRRRRGGPRPESSGFAVPRRSHDPTPAIPYILELNPDIQNYAAATYTCVGDTFTYQFGEYAAVWHRK